MNVETLAALPARIAQLIEGLGTLRDGCGDWSITEHLCHLRDIETEGYSVRIAQLLSEDDPLLRDLDGDALAIERRYREQDPHDALRAFADARAKSVSLLANADDAALAREGTFENAGRITLQRLVEKMHEHDAGHLEALTALAAIGTFERRRDEFRRELEELCRIGGISASAPAEVRRSAEATARMLERQGVRDVRLLEIDGAHPAVYGVIDADRRAPTLLIYGHHDVQPVGDVSRWLTPPFEPLERDGRLFARGSSDDKGGVLAHVAAAASYHGAPPCNLKFFIEGEEEIGSPNLGKFLERYGELLRADCVVLADTPNYDTGIPALTFRLRGMCVIDVEVRCLERPLHSGRGAGAVPDAVGTLCRILASLDVSGIPTAPESFDVPFDAGRFREETGVLEGTPLEGTQETTWTKPAITVIGFDAPPVANAFNQISPSARARLSVRTVPPLDSAEIGARVVEQLSSHPNVTAKLVKSVPWWRTEHTGPAFDAARRALARGYGRAPLMIGSGGTIGFVGAFANAFAGTPLLLMGVEDPPCNAHSENESLHLGDWEKCVRASIFLYHELRCELRRALR